MHLIGSRWSALHDLNKLLNVILENRVLLRADNDLKRSDQSSTRSRSPVSSLRISCEPCCIHIPYPSMLTRPPAVQSFDVGFHGSRRPCPIDRNGD